VGRLLGTGSIEAEAGPIRHCKERSRNDARKDVFTSLTKRRELLKDELIDGVKAADIKWPVLPICAKITINDDIFLLYYSWESIINIQVLVFLICRLRTGQNTLKASEVEI
jgi:hypothetical protein